jgi:hypothetical protein
LIWLHEFTQTVEAGIARGEESPEEEVIMRSAKVVNLHEMLKVSEI